MQWTIPSSLQWFLVMPSTLRAVNISLSGLKWFHSYVFERQQRVIGNDVSLGLLNITAGGPQDGVNSRLVFSIFITYSYHTCSPPFYLYAVCK